MISECMNPDCRRELHYLREGRVVRVVRRDQQKVKVEHFWLCGNCYLDYEFCFSGEGQVSLARKREPAAAIASSSVLTLVA